MQAPFQVVGRLRLLAKSVLPAEACDAHFIDVTRTPPRDSKPIGSINRARCVAESASRNARLNERLRCPTSPASPQRSGAASPAPARAGEGRGRASRSCIARWHAFGASVTTLAKPRETSPCTEPSTTSRYLDQGWGAVPRIAHRVSCTTTHRRARRCTTSATAGSSTWSGRSGGRASPIPTTSRSLNFVVDPAPTPRTRTAAGRVRTPLRRARCRTTSSTSRARRATPEQLNVTRNGRRTAIRIDGGQGMHAFTDSDLGHFVPELGLAVVTTVVNPFKFNRFSNNVLGPEAGLRDKARLWARCCASRIR